MKDSIGPVSVSTRLVWHRKGDLRLHDNELYNVKHGEKIVSLYVINPTDYEPRSVAGNREYQTVTEGPHASRALLEALKNLRNNLSALGGDLVIRRGNPLQVIPDLAYQLQADRVVWSEVPGSYERKQSVKLKAILQHQTNVDTVASYTLFHPDDLPRGEKAWIQLARPNQKRSKKKSKKENSTELSSSSSSGVDCSPGRWSGIPRIMGEFRRAARSSASIQPCYPPPNKEHIHSTPISSKSPGYESTIIEPGELPTMEELTRRYKGCSLFGLSSSTIDKIIAVASNKQRNDKGETSIRKHWDEFLANHAATADRSLADTSNHQSAHTSAALALGTISPRHLVESVRNGPDPSGCQWLVSHMEMRDYFLYTAFAADTKLYSLHGALQQPVHKSSKQKANQKESQSPPTWKPLSESFELFRSWATGQTGLPLVDAGMLEMLATGYCSNRVRQNMASVLTKDLRIDWRVGAEWFQFCLEDHCVGANWGNWQYFGGVGGDPKNRHFRTVSQALKYDPKGAYMAKWLSDRFGEDSSNPEARLRPWDFQEDWSTIVEPSTQFTWQDRQRLDETGSLFESTNI